MSGLMISNYARRMARLSANIFTEVARPTDAQSMKVIQVMKEKPLYLRPEVVDYYPPHNEWGLLMARLRKLGLYRDEHRDFKEEMRRLRALSGKVKPKKGEGKRSRKI